jgi:hypothetical protein
MARNINSKLPAATLTQRLASMSETELMFAARELARRSDADALCMAVLECLEARVSGSSFDAFVAEIYS